MPDTPLFSTIQMWVNMPVPWSVWVVEPLPPLGLANGDTFMFLKLGESPSCEGLFFPQFPAPLKQLQCNWLVQWVEQMRITILGWELR